MCLIQGKFYIGQSCLPLVVRWKSHLRADVTKLGRKYREWRLNHPDFKRWRDLIMVSEEQLVLLRMSYLGCFVDELIVLRVGQFRSSSQTPWMESQSVAASSWQRKAS